MMAEIEIMKKTIANQICALVDGLKMELGKRNIGGDTYQATMVLKELKIAHKMMYTKLIIITINANGRVLYDSPAFQDFFKYKLENL